MTDINKSTATEEVKGFKVYLHAITNKQNLMNWGGFLTASLLVYFFLSNGDFSFLLTYAAFIRCFGFGLLNFRMWGLRSSMGVSVKTLEMYALVFIFRMYSIMQHQGYLPYDKTGDWFYHVVEGLSLIGVSAALYGSFGPFVNSYDEKHDKFGNLYVPNQFGIAYLVIPCFVLALLFHPSLNRDFLSDTFWCLSMYLEAVAMLPQIYMFQKQSDASTGHTVEALIGHTVFALGFARVFELIFWWGSFRELAASNGSGLPGCIVLASQFGHFLIMLDFFYYYFKSLSKGGPIQLPPKSVGLAGLDV